MKVACVQLNSRADVAANVAAATALVEEAAAAGAHLVALPETWTYKGRRSGLAAAAEPPDGPSNAALAALAARHRIYVLAGSLYEPSGRQDHYFNTSVLFGPDGRPLATYRKIHLFDAVSGTTAYRESGHLVPGSQAVLAQVDGVGVGLSICYDLRFPELYRTLALRGARLMLVPSAFTAHTGEAHWEVLLRARAIENACFVIAPDQVGTHLPGRSCWGHSMIVDPWGTVLAVAEDGPGLCIADLDLAAVDRVRAQIPALEHRVPEAYGP